MTEEEIIKKYSPIIFLTLGLGFKYDHSSRTFKWTATVGEDHLIITAISLDDFKQILEFGNELMEDLRKCEAGTLEKRDNI